MARIREIFESIQGEGPLVGYKQIFIRFCSCNLKCEYCDTDFEVSKSKNYTSEELAKIINNSADCHSVSLTGGEPLLETDFLCELLPLLNLPVYLETNGTLSDNLKKILGFVTYISADIKLPSATGLKPLWSEHEKFFEIASKKNLLAKVVFDSGITDDEISKICKLCSTYNIELIMQPKMNGKVMSVTSEFASQVLNKCLKLYRKTRLIPQVHKFIDVE